MDIVINIPDEVYQRFLAETMLKYRGCQITLLEKDHGRLIDADALDMGIVPFDGGDMCLSGTGKMIAEKIIQKASTVIPASKER